MTFSRAKLLGNTAIGARDYTQTHTHPGVITSLEKVRKINCTSGSKNRVREKRSARAKQRSVVFDGGFIRAGSAFWGRPCRLLAHRYRSNLIERETIGDIPIRSLECLFVLIFRRLSETSRATHSVLRRYCLACFHPGPLHFPWENIDTSVE